MEAYSRGVDFFCGTQDTTQDNTQDNAVRACAYVFRYATANWNLLYLFDRMSNNGSPLVGSNLSCIRQINLMMQSAFAEVICISILFQVCIHQGNCYRFIIKRTIVHNLNTHAFING